MKYIKKILTSLVLLGILIPSISFGVTAIGWNAVTPTTGWISPNLINGTKQIIFANNGLFSVASSTFSSNLFLTSLSQGLLFTGTNSKVNSVATTTLTASAPLSLSNTVAKIGGSNSVLTLDTSGTWSGNAGTATALATNGTNCSAGNYPLGVDASGNSESCTTANTGTVTSVTLATPSSTLTLGGTNPVTTSGTINADLNLGHTNTWTVLQNFNYSSSTIYSSFQTSSTTLGIFGTITITNLGTAAGSFLAVDSTGKVIATTTPSGGGGSGTVTSVATTYPVTGGTITTSGTIALAFGTTTSNTWAGLQTFTNSSTSLASFTYASSTLGYVGTLNLPNISSTQCLHSINGVVSGSGSDCGSSSGLSSYDAFTHTSVWGQTTSATSTLLALTGSPYSLVASSTAVFTNASTTQFTTSGTFWLPSLTTGTLNVDSVGQVYKTGTSTPTVTAPITYSGTLGQFIGGVSGAFACTNASSGVTGCLTGTDWNTFNNKQGTISVTYPITLSGATVGFNGLATTSPWTTGQVAYVVNGNTVTSVATSSLAIGASLSNSGTLGSQIGGTASSLSINTANTNTWSVLQNFNYSSTSLYASFLTASSTNLFTAFLTLSTTTAGCLANNGAGLIYNTGSPCGTSSGLTSYDAWTHPFAGQSATTSLMQFNGQASSTGISANYAAFGSSATTSINALGLLSGPYSSSTIYSSFINASSTFERIGTLTLSTTTAGTLKTNASGLVYVDTTSSSGLSSYDAFTHPVAGQSATTSLMLLNGNASTTGLSANYAYFGSSATTSISATGLLSGPYSSSTIYSSFLTSSSTFLNAGSITVATTSAGCAAFMSSGLLTSTGSACGSGGSGDITSVGDVASGAAFDGTQGTTLTFFNSAKNQTITYDGFDFNFSTSTDIPANVGYKIGNVSALIASSTGSVTLVGLEAGKNLLATTTSTGHGADTVPGNTAVGYQALAAATSSEYMTAIGYRALANSINGGFSNSVGFNNTAVGYKAQEANTVGTFGTSIGAFALYNNTKGNENTALGYGALISNTTGSNNTGVGADALSFVSSGTDNIGIGILSGQDLDTGSGNILIGDNAGLTLSTGSGSIGIGTNIDFPSDSSGLLDIGNVLYGSGMYNDVVNSSNAATSNGQIMIGTTTASLARVTIASSTKPQLAFSAGAGVTLWTMRNAGGNLYFATTTVAGTATSTPSALTLNNTGTGLYIGTTTPGATGLSVVGTTYLWGLTGSSGLQVGILCLSAANEVINESVACVASDERAKNINGDFTSALKEISRINPITYTYKPEFNGNYQTNPNFNGEQLGLGAGALQKIDPRLVEVYTKSGNNGLFSYKAGEASGLNTNALATLAIAGVKELNQKVDSISGRAVKSAMDNWQNVVIGLLVAYAIYNEYDKRKRS